MRRSIRVTAYFLFTLAALHVHDGVLAQDQATAGQSAAARGATARNNLYVVQMADLPVVSYVGGIAGLPATRVGPGRKIDPNGAGVQAYAGYLDGQHANDVGTGVGVE